MNALMELIIVMLTLNVPTQMEVSSVSATTVTLEAELFAEVNRAADHCWTDNKVNVDSLPFYSNSLRYFIYWWPSIVIM